MNVSTSGPGMAGPYTEQAGILSYLEICQNLGNGWTSAYNTQQGVPYAYNNDQWVGYDDERSIQLKVGHIILQILKI